MKMRYSCCENNIVSSLKKNINGEILLSVCIVSYNTSDLLKNCILSILNNSNIKNFEVIVVDNHSQDDSVMMIKTNFPEVNIILNNKNEGYARAINKAVNQCKGKFILILNSDTVLLPDTLQKIIQFMMEKKDAGIAGCKILNPDKTIQFSCRSFPGILNFIFENFFFHKIFPHNRLFGRPFMTEFHYNEIREVDVVLGAFMILRRQMIEEIGLMDEQFFMYSEETDYCYRAKRAGWKVFFFPESKIVHFGSQSVNKESVSMFIELHKSHHKFIKKYHSKFYLYVIKMVLFLGICIRLLIYVPIFLIERLKIIRYRESKKYLSLYWITLKWYLGINN